jgi:ATP/ADP translocase/HEAT repeat protein
VSLAQRLSRTFAVERGEGRALTLLILHSFFIGVARWVMETAADAIYLGQADVHTLPLVFIGIGAFSTVLGLIYSRGESWLSFRGLLTATLLFMSASITALWALLVFTHAGWVPVLIAIWNDTIEVFTTVELGALAAWLFNVRQAKRLYALIGCGDVIAGMLGGVAIPPLVDAIGTPALLLMAAAALLAAMFLMQYIVGTTAQAGAEEEDAAAGGKADTRRVPLRERLRDPYLALLLGLAAIDTIVFFFSITAFLADSRARFPDEDDLARFFGVVFAGVSFATLIMRTFVSARFVRRFGLVGGLLLLPVVLLVSSSVAAAAGTVLPGSLFAFWAVILIRLSYAVFFDSTFQPTALMLFQPLARRSRIWAQGFVETVGKPVVTGLAGLLLLAFMALVPLHGTYVAYLLVVCCAGWTIFSAKAARGYTQMLIQALERRSLRGFNFSLEDATTVALLEQGLEDDHPAAVIYCLNQMERAGSDRLDAALLRLLAHPAPEVRIDALQKIERRHPPHALEPVQALLESEPVPAVRAAALRALVACGETDVFDLVLAYLDQPEPEVVAGAMVGLLLHGGIEGVLAAGQTLMHMLEDEQPGRRAFAATILGQVGVHSFYRPLRALLRDADPEVRRAALGAAPLVGNPALWPDVVANLSQPASRHAAARALAAIGDAGIADLERAFEAPGQERRTRLRMVRIAAQVHGPQSQAFLRRRLEFPDCDLRALALEALAARRYQAAEAERPALQEVLDAEIGRGSWLAAAHLDVASVDGPERELMAELELALRHERQRNRDMVFHLLSFLHAADPILSAKANLASQDEEKQAYAIEVLDNLLLPELKAVVLPLVEDLAADEQLRRLAARFPQERLDLAARLADLAAQPLDRLSAWSQACALDAIGRLDAGDLCPTVIARLDSPDHLVREAAVWTLGWIGGADTADLVRPLMDDPVVQVASMAEHVAGQFEGQDNEALIAQLLAAQGA